MDIFCCKIHRKIRVKAALQVSYVIRSITFIRDKKDMKCSSVITTEYVFAGTQQLMLVQGETDLRQNKQHYWASDKTQKCHFGLYRQTRGILTLYVNKTCIKRTVCTDTCHLDSSLQTMIVDCYGFITYWQQPNRDACTNNPFLHTSVPFQSQNCIGLSVENLSTLSLRWNDYSESYQRLF